MRILKLSILFSVAWCAPFISNAQISAMVDGKSKLKDKKVVRVIPITDSSMIPPGAKIIRTEKKSDIDSSRFVKRSFKIDDQRVLPQTASHVKVDPAIYGKHTGFITNYIKNYHKNYAKKLTRIKRQHRSHFSFIENVFRKYDVPKELKALAVIESAMNFKALSPVGARGPWQFMPATGRLLGLRVDQRVDERIDFYKSTKAAARYLRRLNGIYDGDWLLTVAGYNWGPGNITRVLNRSKGKTYWDIKDKLPRETRNHVMAFIATSTYLDNNSTALTLGRTPKGTMAPAPNFGSFASAYDDNPTMENGVIKFKEGQPKIAPAEMDDIAILKVKGAYNLGIISRIIEYDLATLMRWNPKFDTEILTTEKPIYLRIPVDKLELFVLEKTKINVASRAYIDKYLTPAK